MTHRHHNAVLQYLSFCQALKDIESELWRDATAKPNCCVVQVGRIEQVETAKEAKDSRGPKATIRRELTRIHTPATNTGQQVSWAPQLASCWPCI